MASHVEEYPGYKTAIQQQPGIGAKSAINQALNIPEILEMVLVEMDMRTLLTSTQRVCRAWLNLIKASPSIQKALFFTPIKESEWGVGKKTPNPLLVEYFPPFFPEEGKLRFGHFRFSELPMTDDEPPTMPLFARTDATWRNMLVQQPPIFQIGTLHVHCGFPGDRAESSSIPVDEKMQTSGYDGLRMEKYFELLLFSSEVKFLNYTIAGLYWPTERPILLDRGPQNIRDEFQRVFNKFDLLFFTRKRAQNLPPGAISEEETERREIIEAYAEQCVDIDRKRKNIEDVESAGEILRF